MFTPAAITAYSLAIASVVSLGDLAKGMADDYKLQVDSQIAYVRAAAVGDEEAAERHMKASLMACKRIVATAKVTLSSTGQDVSALSCPERE